MNLSRIVIAGTRSGVGKTTLALGLMTALNKRGLEVQPYKVGPDYIDPGFHRQAAGRESFNLDSYFMAEAQLKSYFSRKSKKRDISIVEGVMGLFDGKGPKGESSTAEIAKILQAPVVLIVDGKKFAQSGAALAYGYKNYDQDLQIKAVILNNVASSRHYKLLKEAIESAPTSLKVLGYLPRNNELELPERHLGLVPASETSKLSVFLRELSEQVEEYIDLDYLLDVAESAPFFPEQELKEVSELKRKGDTEQIKIGVAWDKAFNFYYQYNLEMLEKLGAELEYFSPLEDEKLPEVDGVYLGGGFPEMFLSELESNRSFKSDFKTKIKKGLPVYAECGGLMYLSRSVKAQGGDEHEMLGVLPGRVEMKANLQMMGYVEVTATRANLLCRQGERARGHAFHYSSLQDLPGDIPLTYTTSNQEEGYRPSSNILASYIHLHFGSNHNLANNFINSAAAFSRRKNN